MRHDYAQEIGKRIAYVRGSDSQAHFAQEMGVHKNTLGNYERGDRVPDAEFIARLVEFGHDPNWLLTGESPQLMAESGCTSDLPNSAQNRALTPDHAVSAAYTINPKLLEDVLSELRAHQDNAGVRFKVVYEALLAVEIYQYILEEEGPTPEDRAKTRKLVRSIIWGMDNARAHTAEGAD